MAADYVKIYERLMETKVRVRPKRQAEAAKVRRLGLGAVSNGEAGHAGTLQSKPR
jgi:hypothetical protein